MYSLLVMVSDFLMILVGVSLVFLYKVLVVDWV